MELRNCAGLTRRQVSLELGVTEKTIYMWETSANSQTQYMSPQEFLEWERQQELRYEDIDGEVVAMTSFDTPGRECTGILSSTSPLNLNPLRYLVLQMVLTLARLTLFRVGLGMPYPT